MDVVIVDNMFGRLSENAFDLDVGLVVFLPTKWLPQVQPRVI